ncbi:unnamed protein product [Trichobilharzia szidati]|nr:unnamed protein product [Trichobilharzia szidati]
MSDTSHLNLSLNSTVDQTGGSGSGSGSTSTTTEHSEVDRETKASSTSSGQRPHISTWVYIKWFIWSTITSLFGCSIPVFTSPYDTTWPITSVLIDPSEISTNDSNRNETNLSDDNANDAENTNSDDIHAIQLTEVNTSHEADTSTSYSPLTINCDIESGLQITETQKIPLSTENYPLESNKTDDCLEKIEDESSLLKNGYFYSTNQAVNYNHTTTTINTDTTSTTTTTTTTTDSQANPYSDLFLSNSEQLDNTEASAPVTFTLLTSYHCDSVNGLIDQATHDSFVSELINSVLPRNLSDSSEISVPVDLRKMYAWGKSAPCESETVDTNVAKCNSEITPSSLPDDASASPGHCSASDQSFPPLSPSTLEEDSLQTGYFDKTMDIDINLPDVSKSDQTLAWAMSNLCVDNTPLEVDTAPNQKVFNEEKGRTSASLETLSNNNTNNNSNNNKERNQKSSITRHSPVPNSLQRPSRERSPAHLIHSNRLNNPSELSTFLPFEGNQLFMPSDTDKTPETVKPKRSSSLKSSRTVTDVPVPKAVRFADALGLDLATERRVFDSEAPPKIPASATFDLQLDTDECIAKIGAKQFGLCFAQPGTASNFIRRVLTSNVCLEDCHIDMQRCLLTGTIRVKSLGYEKRVTVRITYNNWITFFDTTASYVQGSYDGVTDRFSFSLIFPDTMVPGDKAQFAIRYDTHTGEQFWDNNHGQNYCVTCYAKATDLAGDGSWMHYL